MTAAAADRSRLAALLGRAQDRGLVGPGPVEIHLDHARGFAEAAHGAEQQGLAEAAGVERQRFVDLGSGAGVPGLVLAAAWPASRWALVDASHRSADFLTEATQELGMADRVEVVCGRAEEVGHLVQFRSQADLVVARGFGPPATTAECAAGFLRVGGQLVVSEPPEPRENRWSVAGLARLGQRLVEELRSQSGYHFVVIEQVEALNDRYPRRVGMPRRRPLF